MPHYFFNVLGEDRYIPDSEGQCCSDRDAVTREAYACARDIVGNRLARGEKIDGDIIEVRDERGLVVQTVKLADIIKQAS